MEIKTQGLTDFSLLFPTKETGIFLILSNINWASLAIGFAVMADGHSKVIYPTIKNSRRDSKKRAQRC